MAFGFGFGMPRSFAVPPFSPASLFANGEQGWWYDPSNFSTLFQDSAGTTPVTAMEQPVGLQLDLSKGLVLGPELVTNGDFSSGLTGWSATANATAAVVSGEVEVTMSSVSNGLQQTFTGLTIGKHYLLKGRLRRGVNANEADLRIVTTGGVLVSNLRVTSTSNTDVSGVFVATATSHVVRLQFTASTFPATIFADNISVKELPGNHRFQSTSANRPVVSARVNLLTKTEQFDDAVWPKINATVTPNQLIAPDGTLTVDFLVENTATGQHLLRRTNNPVLTAGTSYTYSIYAKSSNRNLQLQLFRDSGFATSVFDLSSGTVTSTTSGTAEIEPVGDGVYICTIVGTVAAGAIGNSIIDVSLFNNGISYTGDGTSGIYIWGADLRPTNQGVNLPAYQRVNTSTDYDSTGFPVYIKPNGSNQFMQTNSINFTATDKMTVWQGVRKLSDAYMGIVGLSADTATNAGSFELASFSGSFSYLWDSKGTVSARANTSGYAAPITNVVTCLGDISGDRATLRVNGTQVAQSTADQGTGNYGTYPAYFYSRAGTSLFFNGNDYGSIARGAASTAAQITAGENYINSKTKAFA
jgi:hypothetical protein